MCKGNFPLLTKYETDEFFGRLIQAYSQMKSIDYTANSLIFLFKMQNPKLGTLYASGMNRVYCAKNVEYLRKLNHVAFIELYAPKIIDDSF